MSDFVFITVGVGFFALCAAYAAGCERLRGAGHD